MPNIVLDTSVLVAAIKSRSGASFQILSRVGTEAFGLSVSVPLVLEYEDALMRHVSTTPLTPKDVAELLDYICAVANRQPIFFLWRPLLRDPRDDLVAELAIASRSDAIVTHNVRDFRAVDQFGIRVLTPGHFLTEIGGSR